MKDYLKKLGKTKFQAFLVVTITNAILLWGSITGNIKVNDQIDSWMPVLNLIIQTITTVVYQMIEGSIDKEAQKQQVYIANAQDLNATGAAAATGKTIQTVETPYMSYDDIIAKVQDVHDTLNKAVQDLQSGKVTQALLDAQQLYNSIHGFITASQKDGGNDAGTKSA